MPIAGGSLTAQLAQNNPSNSTSSIANGVTVSGSGSSGAQAGGGVNSGSIHGGNGTPDITNNEFMSFLEATMSSSAEQADLNRAFNKAEAEIARKFQAEENQKNRDFTEQMANTSYVRAVQDLQKAGLNPILAYQQGGAASPSAASSVSSAQASYNVGSGDNFSNVLQSFASLANSTSGLALILNSLVYDGLK